MNYKIILDEKKLDEFIEWLPELTEDETYYVALFARKKYAKDILKGDKAQLKRFNSNKANLKKKIKQLECAIGSYTLGDIEIPNEALAIYITVNPRSVKKTAKQTIKTLMDKIFDGATGYNPRQVVMTEMQKAKSRTCYFDFDFDNVSLEDIKSKITFNMNACTFLQTRGGYHVLVDPSKIEDEFKKSWYQTMSKIEGCDVKGDNLIPIVGCNQGGFIPEIVE